MARAAALELVAGCLLVLALVAAPAAQAANIAPNPGFESISCGSAPCNWTALPGSTATIDSGNGSPSSLRESFDGTAGAGVQSDCVVSGTGDYTASFFYKIDASDGANGAFLFAYAFTSTDCTSGGLGDPTGSGVGFVRTLSPTKDGQWHQESGTITVPPTAQSIRFKLHVTSPGPIVHGSFDDVVFDAVPTAVAIASLTASAGPHGVLVRWRTGSDLQFLRFRVYCGAGSSRFPVSRWLAARASAAGHVYSALDPRARQGGGGLRYWLRATRIDGSTSWYGPAVVANASAHWPL